MPNKEEHRKLLDELDDMIGDTEKQFILGNKGSMTSPQYEGEQYRAIASLCQTKHVIESNNKLIKSQDRQTEVQEKHTKIMMESSKELRESQDKQTKVLSRHAKALNWWTFGLLAVAAAQIVWTIIQKVK